MPVGARRVPEGVSSTGPVASPSKSRSSGSSGDPSNPSYSGEFSLPNPTGSGYLNPTLTTIRVPKAVNSVLRRQAREWARLRRVRFLVGPKGGRPAVLQAYLQWLLTEDSRARADRQKRSDRDLKERYVRAVALWDGPRPWVIRERRGQPRPLLSFRGSLLAQWPRNGELELRGRAVNAIDLQVVLAQREREILEPTTVTRHEIPSLVYYRAGDPRLAEYWRRFAA